jgi:hypothetical protein
VKPDNADPIGTMIDTIDARADALTVTGSLTGMASPEARR